MKILQIMHTKDTINDTMDDVCKLLSQILIVHVLISCIDGNEEFLNERIMKKLLYTIIAISVYHFILKKMIKFK